MALLYGPHEIYNRVKRLRIDFDDKANRVLQYETGAPLEENQPKPARDRTFYPRRQAVGDLFILWSDSELHEFGLPQAVVRQLRCLNTEAGLDALLPQLEDTHGQVALNLYLYYSPDGEQPEPEVDETDEADEPEVTAEDLELERRLTEPDAGRWFKRVDPEYMAAILRQPIEDWMVYLHPDQEKLATMSHAGPVYVCGSAGTGKTVVGLHRAAVLAHRNRVTGETRPVLFTSWVKSLPPVLEGLYMRMPGTRAGEVEFLHADGLAERLCEETPRLRVAGCGH